MSTFAGYMLEAGPDLRCDRFSESKDGPSQSALYNFLSHAHIDHMQGLDSHKRKNDLYCSKITRQLVLHMERGLDRVNYDMGLIDKPIKLYDKVRQTTIFKQIESGQTILLDETTSNRLLRIHAIDANHSPGSLMLLVETVAKADPNRILQAVLYTGDIRADPEWVEDLKSVECLKPYLHSRKGKSTRILDKIYLDTAGALSRKHIPSIRDAIDKTINLMKMFPSDTHFFINAWTTGYERFLEAVAMEFETRIHVDRYKFKMMEHIYGVTHRDTLFTRNHAETRFHACERAWKCDATWACGRGAYEYTDAEQEHMVPRDGGKMKRNAGCGCKFGDRLCAGFQACDKEDPDEGLVVYINPAEPFSVERYTKYEANYKKRLECCQKQARESSPDRKDIDWPYHLILPFSRHSALPELRHFVSLFKPKSLFPNTIYDQESFLDYFLLPMSFEGCLDDDAPACIMEEATRYAAKAALYKSQRSQNPSSTQIYHKVHPYLPPAEAEIHRFREAIAQENHNSRAALERSVGPEDVRTEIEAALDEGGLPTAHDPAAAPRDWVECTAELSDHHSEGKGQPLDPPATPLKRPLAPSTPSSASTNMSIPQHEILTPVEGKRKRQKLHFDRCDHVYPLDSDDETILSSSPIHSQQREVLRHLTPEPPSIHSSPVHSDSPMESMSLGPPNRRSRHGQATLPRRSLFSRKTHTSNGTSIVDLQYAAAAKQKLLDSFKRLPNLSESVAKMRYSAHAPLPVIPAEHVRQSL